MTTPPKLEMLPDARPGLPLQAGSPQSWDQKGADIAGLIRPLLEALAKLAGLESTYLTVFDWDRREQEVRFVFSSGETQVEEGHRIPLPAELSLEAFPGVTRSPQTVFPSQADSLVARHLGLKTYVSVPVTVAKHRLFGMLCGASKNAQELSETVVSMFESFAGIMAEHLVNVHIEATEQRAAAAASELTAIARSLTETVQRLKTPLSVSQSVSIKLRDHRDDLSEPERATLHDDLVRSLHHLAQEVEGLLVSGQTEARKRGSVLADLDLGPLVREVARAFGGLTSRHHIVADVPYEVAVSVDPTAMYQVLGHLVDNAITYSPDGSQVTIRVSHVADSVAIDVIDEGIGPPPATDIFVRSRDGYPHYGLTTGIGLGLRVVRDLVEAMDGTVSVRSEPGSGSTFTVRIPRARVAPL